MASTVREPVHSPLPKPKVHITTHNADGKATLYSSGVQPCEWYENQGSELSTVYTTSSFPAELSNNLDLKEHQEAIAGGRISIVRKNGTICRFVDMAPGLKPMMHRTQSLDFGIVLAGHVYMDLDDGSSTLMGPGDFAVQRATMHAWRNASETEWVRMAFILQDIKPLTVDGRRVREDLGFGHKDFKPSNNDL